MRISALLQILLFACLPVFAAENQPSGMVRVEKGKYVSPDEATSLGYFEYNRRWFPKKMEKTLQKWERLDLKHSNWKYAWKTKSKHYRIITNVPRFIIEREIKPFLDELYRTYVKIFKEDFGLSARSANKKFFFIHNGFEDYALHNYRRGKRASRYNPGFIRGASELVTYYSETDPAEFYHTAFHEGAHQFVMAVLPGAQFPIWIDEALAVYFEGCFYSRSEKKITINHLSPDRLYWAQKLLGEKQRDPRQLLATVMDLDQSDFEAEHYALAWSFVYFLTHGENSKYRKPFFKFLHEMNGAGVKRTSREIFKQVVKVDPLDLANQWKDFVLKLPMPHQAVWALLSTIENNDKGLDLKKGDILFRFSGCDISSAEQFNELWAKRTRDKEHKLTVVRREPEQGSGEFNSRMVDIIIPADAKVVLASQAILMRHHNLAD